MVMVGDVSGVGDRGEEKETKECGTGGRRAVDGVGWVLGGSVGGCRGRGWTQRRVQTTNRVGLFASYYPVARVTDFDGTRGRHVKASWPPDPFNRATQINGWTRLTSLPSGS